MVFADESGFSLLPAMPKTWAPRGQTPVLRHRMSWPKLSAIAAVAPNPHIWMRLVRGTVRSRQVVSFVRYLLRTYPGRIMLFWDGLGAHRSRYTREALRKRGVRLSVHRLPAYAPELNPTEGVFAYLKHHHMRGYCPPEIGALMRKVRQGVRAIRKRPDLIKSFFRRTPLSLEITSTYLRSCP